MLNSNLQWSIGLVALVTLACLIKGKYILLCNSIDSRISFSEIFRQFHFYFCFACLKEKLWNNTKGTLNVPGKSIGCPYKYSFFHGYCQNNIMGSYWIYLTFLIDNDLYLMITFIGHCSLAVKENGIFFDIWCKEYLSTFNFCILYS